MELMKMVPYYLKKKNQILDTLNIYLKFLFLNIFFTYLLIKLFSCKVFKFKYEWINKTSLGLVFE